MTRVKFNLLQDSPERRKFLKSVSNSQFEEKWLDKIDEKIEIFNVLKINREYFYINKNGCCEIGTEEFPAISLLRLAEKLNLLAKYRNFESLSNGFNNSMQFSSTIFEVESSLLALSYFKAEDLEFSPEIKVHHKIKKPDFRLFFSDGTTALFECKSLMSINRIKQSGVNKLKESLIDSLKPHFTNENTIEVVFKTLPTHWNKKYVNQITDVVKSIIANDKINEVIRLVINKKHETFIVVRQKADKQMLKATIYLGDNYPLKANLIVGQLSNLTKDIKESLIDAESQLPPENEAYIFIYPLNEQFAINAINQYFQNRKPKHIKGVFSTTTTTSLFKNPFFER